ncbi:GNAT family N-acetyltransferase [Moritella sp. Urea-trap-13]|uniref:GNAT family N-acetyltransferase n=1 Tax=Moritella sp. Urea-trap-13 TaxID=2058327 RepID=UPI000C34B0A6|nr:GNAT family N-acetyltransferase [Moritella sp. Urea-trap-13]PKH06929.1 GNAT family N-acetyltransferase [Moritella sp. Urea-trap-13]
MIIWQTLPFNKLSTLQFHELIKLRINIFVVEQTCPYPELDDKDIIDDVYHLVGSQNDEIIACARLLPAGISYENVSLGRVATKETARGNGLGHQLIIEALKQCEQHWPGKTIDIGAQEYLQTFYQNHGFKPISEVYMEDGIPHIDMRLNK